MPEKAKTDLWTSDQPGAETPTWQHTTWQTSMPPARFGHIISQQMSGRRPRSHSIRLSDRMSYLRVDNVENYRAVNQMWTVLLEINTTQQYTLCKFLIRRIDRPTCLQYNQNNINLNNLNMHHPSANSTFIHNLYISLTLRHKDSPPHNRRIFP